MDDDAAAPCFIRINIRPDHLQLSLPSTATLDDLCQAISRARHQSPQTTWRLVFRGKVLKSMQDTLKDTEIADSAHIYAVADQGQAQGGMDQSTLSLIQTLPDPDDMGPMGKIMAKSLASNPELVMKLRGMDKKMSKVAEKDPMIAQLMQDPKHVAHSVEMVMNPKLRREMMRNVDRAMQNIEAMPGGWQHLVKTYKDVQAPLLETEREDPRKSEARSKRIAEKLGVDVEEGGVLEEKQPLPNPWQLARRTMTPGRYPRSRNKHKEVFMTGHGVQMPSTLEFPMTMQDLFGSPLPPNLPTSFRVGTTSSSPSVSSLRLPQAVASPDMIRSMSSQTNTPSTIRGSVEDMSTRFKTQLDRLSDMGFTDVSQNIRALVKSNGDVDSAVEQIILERGDDV